MADCETDSSFFSFRYEAVGRSQRFGVVGRKGEHSSELIECREACIRIGTQRH